MSNTNDLKPTPRTDIKEMIIGQCLVEGAIHPEDALRDMAKHAREIECELAERPSAKVETPLKPLPAHCPTVAYIHPKPEGRYGHSFGLHEHQDGTGDCGTIPSCESEGCVAVEVSALLASQAARGETPVAFARVIDKNKPTYEDVVLPNSQEAEMWGFDLVPLYTHPPVDQGLREALRDFMAVSVCGVGFKTAEQHEAYWRAHEKAVAALTSPTGKKD